MEDIFTTEAFEAAQDKYRARLARLEIDEPNEQREFIGALMDICEGLGYQKSYLFSRAILMNYTYPILSDLSMKLLHSLKYPGRDFERMNLVIVQLEGTSGMAEDKRKQYIRDYVHPYFFLSWHLRQQFTIFDGPPPLVILRKSTVEEVIKTMPTESSWSTKKERA